MQLLLVAATWTSLNLPVTLFEVQVEEPGAAKPCSHEESDMTEQPSMWLCLD